MATIRTLNFLPDIFKTPSNSEFLTATLDQLVNQSNTSNIQGFVGSKFGYGVNATSAYVVEPTAARTNYQLDPGVVFTAPATSVNPPAGTAVDFISYPGMIDALKMQNGITANNSRLFKSQFYSWDSFTALDKIVNYYEYYWLPNGPPAVTVAASNIYFNENYNVTALANGYEISPVGKSTGSINPTLTFLRGGSYQFIVDQTSQFWIQTAPGVSGYSPVQPNVSTREVYGVNNNGAEQGVVTFDVPAANAQDQYVFPSSTTVDVISTLPFDQVNGALLNTYTDPATGITYPGLNDIDGVTALDGLTVMFYNDGIPDEVGFTSEYFDETEYDTNNDVLVAPITLTATSCDTSEITVSTTTTGLVAGQTVTFDTPVFGGITAGQVYYVYSIPTTSTFTIAETLNATSPLTLSSGSGTMTVNVNQGLLEEGFYSHISANFYTIQYVVGETNTVIRLVPTGSIPINTNIIPLYGIEWANRPFYCTPSGTITLVPVITAPLTTLYYQDGSSANSLGVINIVDSNTTNTIDVVTDILGKKSYTSLNGVVFTNGLKVSFQGDVVPASYLQDEYYVEGVGTAIQLIPVSSLFCPESFTTGTYIPFDSTPYDMSNYDIDLYIPTYKDYITIARNSINKNAWSRSNRWFHIDVINSTAVYNNDPSIATKYATQANKATRPIVEFYPNLQLFNSGAIGGAAIDFIDTHNTDALLNVAGAYNYYPDTEAYSGYVASIAPVTAATTTTITVAASSVTGVFQPGMYIGDSASILPVNSQVVSVSGTTTLTIEVSWGSPKTVITGTNVALFGTDSTLDDFALFPGSRVVFAADSNPEVANKIYVANFSTITPNSAPVITLTVAEDGDVVPAEMLSVIRGYYYQGTSFFYNGSEWLQAQQKVTVNQPPLFDIFDSNGVSFGDASVYQGTSFAGCKLFSYAIGSGTTDPILGFPLKYSGITELGDITFNVNLNSDTFNYVSGTSPVTQNVNTGYVYNYTSGTDYVRQLGWQTAIADSVQYQIFSFNFDIANPSISFQCDVAAVPEPTGDQLGWPNVKVYYNNVYQNPTEYVTVIGTDTTTITFTGALPTESTVIQILVLSNQVSQVAYYEIPTNLNNNPLNGVLTTVNVGDIQGQYRDIFINAPNTTGNIFGSNNFRDCGDLVPYGTEIIQNSASLVLPGTFFRNSQYNIFDSLMYNSREYINYKQLLVNTVQNTDYVQRYTPSQILNIALTQITAAKSEINSFYWSDMVPAGAPYISNTYTFNNSLDVSTYPLSQVYNFDTANYNGVLVYVFSTVDGVVIEKQLTSGVDYIVSTESPSLTITLDLNKGDQITINEYNQTYGSYVPNTPTKLGLYPSFHPAVVLDSDYTIPTYFILGHDGSYTKLYGTYNEELGVLVDYRDQALLEFELRIYNNLKLSTTVPIEEYEIVPGYFRSSVSTYSWNEFIEMYDPAFLNWIGQNRLDYKTQYYQSNDEFTYNYTNSGNKLDQAPIQQGYWRGVYQYFYDTTTPNETPWEMLNFANEPTWWTARYGPAPYTSDNGILWGDLEAGLIWNNGYPYINLEFARPGLSKIIPVDSNGDLLSPLIAILGNYNPSTFQKDWVVGDDAPTELSYRRSSTWPFDLMRLFALTRPAEFFNLGADLDNYKYNQEFNQYLVNDRSYLIPANLQVYGSGTAKTSYINWIVDYQKQQGIDATTAITTLLQTLDVRLVYRLAGYSDQALLQFYVEKGSPGNNSSSLLIPDENYNVLLYENQPFDQIMFSGVVIQQTNGYWNVYGNSQTFAYFTVLAPKNNGSYGAVNVLGTTVKYANDYTDKEVLIPYGTTFYSTQAVVQFLMSYNAYLQSQGMIFNNIENAVEVTWAQMAAEFVYWSMTGWQSGSLITLNPAAATLVVDQPSAVVQPLTIQEQNFILNQNLYPIKLQDLNIQRDGTAFYAKTLNQGDTMAYAQFNVSNFENAIVFDNVTIYNDLIYNLTTGLRQNRIYVRGAKSAEWNGTVNASGFILNQTGIQTWNGNRKYTKGQIVQYKNQYYAAQQVIEPSSTFQSQYWKITNYKSIAQGMLPNSSTRSYESTLYYDIYQANLSSQADLLAFELIGYRPRDYLALTDLTDPALVQVYQSMIKNLGTLNGLNIFQGADLQQQGAVAYSYYENWAILRGEFGGVLNHNFVDFRINQANINNNPSIVSLTIGVDTSGSNQEIPLYSLFNYGTLPTSPNILTTVKADINSQLYPSAGYVNIDDVEMSSYFFSGLPIAVNSTGAIVPIQNFYVGQYFWLANFKNSWNVYKWRTIGQVVQVRNNTNGTATVTFNAPHNLSQLDPVAIINFGQNVDGYYIVTSVLNLTQITINLTGLNASQNTIQGLGLGFAFESQRVATPAAIAALDLTENEFITNTVWVDENTDGNWAVYQKNINYAYQSQLEIAEGASTFGTAVAYTPDVGYLVSDAGTGMLYRYTYNAGLEEFTVFETITGNTSFGTAIAHSQNIYVVSEPTSVSPVVNIYTLNNTKLSNSLVPYQSIAIPEGATDWGNAVAISGDTNWIYISDVPNNDVYVYRRQNIPLDAGYFVPGQTYTITDAGTTDFTAIGAIENTAGIVFVATGVGSGTGTATQITYEYSTVINGSEYSCSGSDGFGSAIATDQIGDTVIITAPYVDYSMTISNWGSAFAIQRSTQNFLAQSTNQPEQTLSFPLAWSPNVDSTVVTATSSTGNLVTCSSTAGMSVNDPIVFSGSIFVGSNISDTIVYYINSIVSNQVTLKTSRSSTTEVALENFTAAPAVATSLVVGKTYQITTLGTTNFTLIGAEANTVGVVFVATGVGSGNGTATPVMIATAQVDPLYVSRNGTLVTDNNYAVIGNNLVYYGTLRVGDIINVSDNQFFPTQTINSPYVDRNDIEFGYAVDVNQTASTVLIGSPYEVDSKNREGAVYAYVNGGAKYGLVVGTGECNLASDSTILINGFAVPLSPGNAQHISTLINNSNIINVQASYTNANTLLIQVIDQDITQINEKLKVEAYDDGTTLAALGIVTYNQTQVIKSPHAVGRTQFGSAIKLNEFGSVAISAPVETRYEGTFFDFTDKLNLINDTVFDNNATQFVDQYPNAGAVYMYDYLSEYNESLSKPGAFVYAQSVNSTSIPYGSQPLYGASLDFNNNTVIVGSPDFYPVAVGGQVVTYTNASGIADWSIYRQSAAIVDTSLIQNTQLYSASTNNTLVNLDYLDPLQGKMLGAVRENLDYIAGADPARYNSPLSTIVGSVWGTERVGQLWLNTTNIRWINYHQNDPTYNATYWGAVFPGSDVAVYTWVASFVPPTSYPGPGAIYDPNLYVVGTTQNASNNPVPVYYFWVRNTGVIFEQTGKTLSDTVVASYIANPKGSGISYMAPILPNAFALYNTESYINANDSVFHIGYSNGTSNDTSHQEYALIRDGFQDDFLPGLPRAGSSAAPSNVTGDFALSNISAPYSLYAKILDSFAGSDTSGSVVPNHWLPLAVQSGVLARPNQSFFYDRLLALENYLTYANSTLAQYPIAETRPNAYFLFASGPYFNTADYWSYVNWWATGYNNSTKSSTQVPLYADLATLNVAVNTIVTVQQNGSGNFEVYRYDGYGVWTRIGLQNGTIAFDSSLWNYASANFGFGNNFFDTESFDQYPSEETRWIIRALNEQIYIDDLQLYRNSSLILIFEYIQSETIESQNFLPWLNKTSLADVNQVVRQLIPYQLYQTDNTQFLSGYIEEVKPYHVLIKDFLYSYTGNDVFEGDITDFDVPATFDTTYQQYISPQLVYTTPSNQYEYLPNDPIWQTAPYTQWFNNQGVSITGQDNHNITTTVSYMDLASNTVVVANANGFPINGTIKIDDEIIGYSVVNRALNLLSGLTRGVNGTPIENHLPGANIFINLPAALVLYGARGYTQPPRVTAYIDTAIYPAPRIPAVLEAVMNLDSVLQINVINPGSGYAVLPEIVIEPAAVLYFSNTAVNALLRTINVYSPNIQTGDQLLYRHGTEASVGNLQDNQWYYVNVLATTPTAIVALYTSYKDAVNDTFRVPVYPIGVGSDMSLSLGARASAISTSYPVRENNITIKFDRTTYGSQLIDWQTGEYYGAFFAGDLNVSSSAASSSVTLEATAPPISTILASAQGAAFEIASVENDQQVEWSSLIRYVSGTTAANNAIALIIDSGLPNASGSTIGFYVGMPLQFTGTVFGNLVNSQVYYVHSVISETEFTVSETVDGSVFALSDSTVGNYTMECLIAEVTNTAIMTINYPGILQVTATQATTNTLTVPISPIGTGGTAGFYTNLPIFFTENAIGGIALNKTYYVTTVIDDQTFTMSATDNPTMTTASSIDGSTDRVTLGSIAGLSINDIVIFNNMSIAGSSVTDFGGVIAGTLYYISGIFTSTREITLSASSNGETLSLSTVVADTNTSATMTDQSSTVSLTTATGSMTMNVALPVSPGQINGQLFTLYGTSGVYPNVAVVSDEVTNLINVEVNATIGTVNRVALSNMLGQTGTTNFYTNMPVRFSEDKGNLVAGTTYWVLEYSGDGTNADIVVNSTNTASSGNVINCDTTASLYVNMQIIFSGQGLGGISIGNPYFVRSIVSPTSFTISETVGGSTFTLFTANGTMQGVGDPFITVSDSLGGAVFALSADNTTASTLSQYVTSYPTFDISYVLGGYRVAASTAGTGFAIDTIITIPGTVVGGASPANDITLTVSGIDADGGITNVIVSGTVPDSALNYYLKVISPTQVAVYSNPLMTVPVSGIDFPFNGFTETTVTSISSNIITVNSTTGFEINDAVVFTGSVSDGVTSGQTYYIISSNFTANTLKVSEMPGGSSVSLTNASGQSYTMAKAGAIAFLPEPFYFNQSIVKFNNRVYTCLISNNDTEFVFGKWELLDSNSSKLNAMDRVMGYYQPSVNMPGLDLTQLFAGVTYPNSTYQGNAFQPSEQFTLDTILQDQPFYPTQVNLSSIVYYNGTYLATANLPTQSAVLSSTDGVSWAIARLTNMNIDTTSVTNNNGIYLISSTNNATPIFRGADGVKWTVTNTASQSIQSIAYGNGAWVGVGTNIVRSVDTNNWNQVYTFESIYEVELYSVTYAQTSQFTGFVAVGSGLMQDYSTGVSILVPTNIVVYSTDGLNWRQVSSLTARSLYAVVADGTAIYALGENGIEFYSYNAQAWYGNEVTVSSFSTSNYIINTEASYFQVDDSVRFTNSFSSIVAGTTYYVQSVISPTLITISDSLGGPVLVLSAGSVPASTLMYAYNSAVPAPLTVKYVTYANSTFVAVGNTGLIKTSSDGITWTVQSSGTTQNLNGVTYNSDTGIFTVVGDNNTVINSTDDLMLGEVMSATQYDTIAGFDGQSNIVITGGNGANTARCSINDLIITITNPGSGYPVGESIAYLGTSGTRIYITVSAWIDNSIFTVAPAAYDVQGAAFPFGYGPEELVPGVITDNTFMTVITRPGTNWPVTTYSHTGFNVVSVELTPTSGTQTVYSFARVVEVPAQVSLQIIDPTTSLGTGIADGVDYTVDWVNKTVTLTTPLAISPAQQLRIDVYEVGNGNQLIKSNTDNDPIRMNDVTGLNEIYVDCNYSAAIYLGGGVIQPGTQPITVQAVATDGPTSSITCVNIGHFILNSAITFEGGVFGGIQSEVTYYVKSINAANDTITVSATNVGGIAGPTYSLTTAAGDSMYVNIQTGNGQVWTPPIIYHNGNKLILGATNIVTATSADNNGISTNSTLGLVIGSPIVFSDTMFGTVIQPLTTYYIASVIDGFTFTISTTSGGAILALTTATGGASFVTNDYAFGVQPNGISAKLVFATGSYVNSADYIVYSLLGQTTPGQIGYAVPEIQYFTGNGSSSSFDLSNYVGASNPDNAIVEINGVRQTLSQYTINTETNTILFSNSPPPADSVISVLTYNDTQQQYLTSQYGLTGNPGSALTTLTVGSTTRLVGTYDQNTPTAQTFDQDTPEIILYDENLNYLTLSSGTTASLAVNNPIVFFEPVIGGVTAGVTYYVIEIINTTDFVISETVDGPSITLTDDSGSMDLVVNGLTVAPISAVNNTLVAPLAVTYATATTSVVNEITAVSVEGFVENQYVQFFGAAPMGNVQVDGTVYLVDTFDIATNTFTIKDQYGNQIILANDTGALQVIVGGVTAVRVTTTIPHNFVENDLVRIDGTTGSVQLNNNIYYARVLDDYTFDLYQSGIPGYTGYDPTLGANNYPVTSTATYTGGGYTWRAGLFYIATTYATASSAIDNTITVESTADLVVDTPIYFSELETIEGTVLALGNLVSGTEYYVSDIISDTEFTVSATQGGPTLELTAYSGSNTFNVTQWSQENVDRIWVTINGLRVPSSNLRINPTNEVSILSEIVSGDEVIITSMIAYATPNEEVYLNLVDKDGLPAVYRANSLTKTWLTQPIYDLSTTIYVNDATTVTDTVVYDKTVPIAVDGYYYIGIPVDKNTLASVTVFDNTTGQLIDSSNYAVVIVDTAPNIQITPGPYINQGDSLTITAIDGNLIYINGEMIRFSSVDFTNNSLSGLQRGVNGTGMHFYVPVYSQVFGLLSSNMLPGAYYNKTWNSYTFNTVLGDPLQISTTTPAQFLLTDIG